MIDESDTDTKYKKFYKLTLYEMLLGKFSDVEIEVMSCIYNYIMR